MSERCDIVLICSGLTLERMDAAVGAWLCDSANSRLTGSQ